MTLAVAVSPQQQATIGDVIREARERKGVSFAMLAIQTAGRVGQNTIRAIEKGMSQPKPETLRALAGPLGLDYSELLRLAGYWQPDTSPGDEPDPSEAELLRLFRPLSPTARAIALELVRRAPEVASAALDNPSPTPLPSRDVQNDSSDTPDSEEVRGDGKPEATLRPVGTPEPGVGPYRLEDSGAQRLRDFGKQHVSPDRFSWSFRRIAKKAEVAIPLHGARHSFATMLLKEGVPLPDASAALGHQDPSITARIYSHVLKGHEQETAAALTRAMRRGQKVGEKVTDGAEALVKDA